MDDIVFAIFKDFLRWIDENNLDDNLDNYMKYLEENRKLNMFKYKCL